MKLGRHEKRELTRVIRAQVFERARGKCEACKRPVGESGHLDHFFGRAKAPTALETCWALCLQCDDDKTNNRPSAIAWLRLFWVHCRVWGYEASAKRAETKALTLKAKGLAGPVGRAA